MKVEEKEQRLKKFIGEYQSVLVAFSGGVDSSYLAFIANQVLGQGARMVTALSPSVSGLQKESALSFAESYGLDHRVIQTQEMENSDYTKNSTNRCYFCKSELYTDLNRLREKWGAEVIFDGSNTDDVGDYRPGRQAAANQGVVSPFIEVGIRKDEIRFLSRKWGLPTWDQPAMPCLSSRFPYGVAITEAKLRQVDCAESFLRNLGFKNFRVRHHENLARIEIDPSEMAKILDLDLFDKIDQSLNSLGYRYVTLDLKGFRSGSLNEILELESFSAIKSGRDQRPQESELRYSDGPMEENAAEN